MSAARKLLVRDRALGADVPDAEAEEAEEAAAPRTLISASMIPRFVISGFSSAVSWCRRTRGRDAMVAYHAVGNNGKKTMLVPYDGKTLI